MPAPRLDRIDMNILAALQRNGRMTNAQLAEAVGLSPSPCLLRVKRLQSAGIITGYGAQLDLRKLGSALTIFLEVTLIQHHSATFQRFEAGLRRRPEVVECHLISGGFDYLVKLVVRELSHYQDLMEGLLEENIGIAKYFSYVVVKSPIEHGEVPLKLLFDEDARG